MGPAARALIDGPTNYIDGKWEDGAGSEQLHSLNPTTTEPIRDVPVASVEQAERAVLAARRAFDSGPWSRVTPRERSDLLLSLADVLERNAEELDRGRRDRGRLPR